MNYWSRHDRCDTPRVAVMGFYGRGNFGDDLMAYMCGRHLAANGIPSTLFSLGDGDADSLAGSDFLHAGLRTTQDAEQLLDEAKLLVYGGGGMLVSWPPGAFESAFPYVAAKCQRVVSLARERGIRRAAISVGSHGNMGSTLVPRYKQDFVDGADYVSVRNREDLEIVSRLGVPADHFVDMVWHACQFFPRSRSKNGRITIGIDLFPNEILRHRAIHFLALLQAVATARRDITFVAINSTHRIRGTGAPMRPWLHGRNVERYQFHDFESDMTLLASLDLLVSTRLHVPLVCLQYGVPVVSVFPQGKTRLCFESIGLGAEVYGHGRLWDLFWLLSRSARLDRYLASYPVPELHTLTEASRAHLDKLVELAKKL